ncbi:hypothetical protein T11_10453 [Trichinella zimbabwensis]|uniref:Uncharacterized protein n=1 Tax=Trichinella zimbabwensis TaxID=268475 RepID=A0A0V1HK78_9BILA|nr:hypothetical protein T11_10453 [Trichinella zimbabwensis]
MNRWHQLTGQKCMDGEQQLSVLMRYDVALIIHARIVTSSVMLFPVIKRFWIWYAFWKSEIPVSSVVVDYSFEWLNIDSSTDALVAPSLYTAAVCMVSHVAAIFVAFISISNVKWRCTGKSQMYLMYNQPSTVADLVIQNSQKHKSYFSTLVDMYAVDLEVQCKVVSAYEVPHHNRGAANGKLVYGSTGSAIPDACFRLVNRFQAFMFRLPLSS